MADNNWDISEYLICLSCLCYEKNISDIGNNSAKMYFLQILDEIQLNNIETKQLKICINCEALLNKCVSFREQVKDSYRILHSYTKENLHEHLTAEIIRSPRLIIKQLPNIDILPTKSTSNNVNSIQIFVKDEENSNDIDSLLMKHEKGNNLDSIFVKGEGKGPNLDDNLKDKEVNIQLENVLKQESDNSNDDDHTINLGNDFYYENDGNDSVDSGTNISFKKKKTKCKKTNQYDRGCKVKTTKLSEPTDHIKTIELTFEDMLAERAKLTLKESYLTSEYKCESCVIGFGYDKLFNEHVWAKHRPELGDYPCPVCKTILSTVERFTAHYRRHLRRYECVLCNKRSSDKKLIQLHYDKSHTAGVVEVEYKCNICDYVTKSAHSLRYHKDVHKRRIQCPECDKTFSHRAGLTNHRLAIHNSNCEFSCKLCSKKFKYKPSLSKHMKIHVDGQQGKLIVARCDQCGIDFTRPGSYQRHLKHSLKHVTQEQFKFTCDYCGRRYANKTKLRDHIEEKHLHRTYQCDICFKPSKNRVCLDQHIRNVHKGRPNNKMCHHCGKGFPTREQLDSHIRSHTGEKPFICEYCPTRFSQKSNLYKHNRQVHQIMKLMPMFQENDKTESGCNQNSSEEPSALVYYNLLGKIQSKQIS